ncbi:hypothetical protein DFH28DRAFT_366693 [Melampsora americana]|nr:hypothetical protein DFH28DRAFT_366693 [Melampsora americana]
MKQIFEFWATYTSLYLRLYSAHQYRSWLFTIEGLIVGDAEHLKVILKKFEKEPNIPRRVDEMMIRFLTFFIENTHDESLTKTPQLVLDQARKKLMLHLEGSSAVSNMLLDKNKLSQ